MWLWGPNLRAAACYNWWPPPSATPAWPAISSLCGLFPSWSTNFHHAPSRPVCRSSPSLRRLPRRASAGRSGGDDRQPAAAQPDSGGVGHVWLRAGDGWLRRSCPARRHRAQDDHAAAAQGERALAHCRDLCRPAQFDRARQRRHRRLPAGPTPLSARVWGAGDREHRWRQSAGVCAVGRSLGGGARHRWLGAEHLLPQREPWCRSGDRSGALPQRRGGRARGDAVARDRQAHAECHRHRQHRQRGTRRWRRCPHAHQHLPGHGGRLAAAAANARQWHRRLERTGHQADCAALRVSGAQGCRPPDHRRGGHHDDR